MKQKVIFLVVLLILLVITLLSLQTVDHSSSGATSARDTAARSTRIQGVNQSQPAAESNLQRLTRTSPPSWRPPEMFSELGKPAAQHLFPRGKDATRRYHQTKTRDIEPELLKQNPSVLAKSPQDGRFQLLPEEIDEHTLVAGRLVFNPAALDEVIQGKTSRVMIPTLSDEVLTLEFEKIITRSANTHTLQGHVAGEKETSTAQIVYHDGILHGNVMRYDSQQELEYRILSDGYMMVRELDHPTMTDDCATCSHDVKASIVEDDATVDEGEYVIQNSEEIVLNSTAGWRTVDIVVGYGQEARIADGGHAQIEARIIDAVDRVTGAFANSGIADAELMLLGTIEDPDYLFSDSSASNMGLEISALRSEGDGDLDTVTDFSNQLGADLSCFVILEGRGGTAGVQSADKYLVVSRTNMTPGRMTFAHEIGHALGGGHAWGDSSNAVDTSRYAWRLISPDTGNTYKTIISYNNGIGGTTIPYYSNPAILYEGARTGAVNGYNVLNDPTTDPIFYEENGIRGFDGSNPDLGANNASLIDSGDPANGAGLAHNSSLATRTVFEVINPLDGARWEKGTTETIKFNGGDMQDLVTIKLYKAGALHSTLAVDVNPVTHRNFAWTIPFSLPGASDYMIRVELESNGSTLTADSDIFEIFSDLPHVNTQSAPAMPQGVGVISSLELTFNVPMNPATFSQGSDIISFTDPIGTSLTSSITGTSWSGGNTILTIQFNPPSQPGTYQLVLGPDVEDTAGNKMDQDSDGTPGESVDDHYTANFIVNPPLIYYANMDADPGWTFSANNPVDGWAYGPPTGGNGYSNYGIKDPTTGYDGPNVIGYNLNGDYERGITSTRWATIPAIDCSSYENVTLNFQRWLGVYYGGGNGDNVYIEVSNDGSNWTTVWDNDNLRLKEAAWTEVEYDISAVADGQPTVFIRWGMGTTNSSFNDDSCGWNIDEVIVTGDSSSALAVTPTGDLSASGMSGGPFTPGSIDYTLENTGSSPIQWTAAKTANWVNLSAASGTLAGGATTTVTATINSNADALGIGNYSDTVTFTNVTNSLGNATRSVNLDVLGPGTLVVASANNLGFSGTYGGSFTPASQAYTLSNGGTTSIDWTASKTANWVTLDSAAGTLAPGAETTVTVSINGNADALNAGGYSDTLTFTNTTNNSGDTTRDVILTVDKAAAAITLSGLSTTYDGTPQAATATTTPVGLSHTITYDGSAIVPTNAGTYSVLATITETNYSGNNSGSLVIGKANQSITFSILDPVADNASPFSLSGTASSGLAVSYTSSNPSVATVSGDTVTVVGLGSTIITASQAGDSNYNAASSVPQTLDVVRDNPIADPNGPYRVLSGQSLVLDGSASLPSVGETITTYEWDLNNDNTYGDVTGVSPAAIDFNTLMSTWGMSAGFNDIGLKVTDSGGKTSVISTTVQLVFPLFWDANGTGVGQTNGGGAWLGTNLWWDGSANTDWVSGSAAVFGGLSSNGGTVALASPTTVDSLTFNTFNGTYTLGTTGQTITLNDGIDMTTNSSSVAINSPITLTSQQTWANNSTGTLTLNGAIDGSGGITKTGTGTLILKAAQNANSYTRNTRILGGILQSGTSWSSANNIPGGMSGSTGTGQSNIEINGGTFTQYYYNTRTLGSGPGQIQITGGRSGFTNKQGDNTGRNWRVGDDNTYEIVWGSEFFKPDILVLQDAAANPGTATFTIDNKIDLNGADRTVEVGASTGGIAQIIRNSNGTAGLIKTGAGTLVLSATNTYNGDTTVQAGTLQINSANTNNESSTVSIAAGATLDLNFSGTDTIDKLVVEGVQMGSGQYKAFGSAASGTELSRLTGTGTLTVTSDPPADTTPPTLVSSSIVDDKGGDSIIVNALVTYTITFSEDMDATTVSAADFGNAGTSTVTIGTVTETSSNSGVFTVPVSTTSTGTLQLQINPSAVLKDVAGNDLNTTSAIADDTTIAVQSNYVTWSGGAARDADANNDGVDNELAWMLGAADPSVNANALLPTFDSRTDPDFFIFTYRRSDAANADPNTSVVVQYSSNMNIWMNAVQPSTDIIISTVDNFYGLGIDKVQVKIKRTLASDGTLFSRLNMQNLP